MGIVKEILGHFEADEAALHTLRELDNAFLPEMIAAYRGEINPQTRSVIVEAIWQHREPSSCRFLAEVLQDHAPEVWKQALDGLVILATPEAVGCLQSASAREQHPEKRAWIEEAISQIKQERRE